MPVEIGALVIGAGVIGLAVARQLALAGIDTVIVDGEDSFGSWTSSRNSEVIHAGIYYPAGSRKAELCVRGRELLYPFCERAHVPHARLGKLIFAAEAEQTPALDKIEQAAEAAGVRDLARLSGIEAKKKEPAIDCHEALFSPSTGIIDAHGYMLALLADAENAGATFARRTRVSRLTRAGTGWSVGIEGEDRTTLTASIVVNSAGLAAHRVASATEGLAAEHVPQVRYARGVYFTYAGKVPFSHLIYPVPVPGGLGTHLTLDLSGAARFGPDVEWIDAVDYTVDPGRHAQFLAAARSFWPEVQSERMVPGYAGIRPKLSGPGEPAADFRIDGPVQHGLPGLVNLFGIESPGLTASLAIAQEVAHALDVPVGPG